MSVIGQLPVEDHLSHIKTRLKIGQGPVGGHSNFWLGTGRRSVSDNFCYMETRLKKTCKPKSVPDPSDSKKL